MHERIGRRLTGRKKERKKKISSLRCIHLKDYSNAHLPCQVKSLSVWVGSGTVLLSRATAPVALIRLMTTTDDAAAAVGSLDYVGFRVPYRCILSECGAGSQNTCPTASKFQPRNPPPRLLHCDFLPSPPHSETHSQKRTRSPAREIAGRRSHPPDQEGNHD